MNEQVFDIVNFTAAVFAFGVLAFADTLLEDFEANMLARSNLAEQCFIRSAFHGFLVFLAREPCIYLSQPEVWEGVVLDFAVRSR